MKQNHPAIAALLGLVALLAACRPGPDAPKVVERPWIEALAAGTFVPVSWLDIADNEARRVADGRRFDAGTTWMLRDGWAAPEPWGAWALGERATADLIVRTVEARDLLIDARLPLVDPPLAQTISVSINDVSLGGFTVGAELETHRLAVPADALRIGTNRVELRFAEALTPSDDERRALAAAVARLGLVAPGAPPPAYEQPPVKADAARDTLYLLRPGSWVVPVIPPSAGARLRFELRVPEGAELAATLLDFAGTPHPSGAWQADGPVDLPLDVLAGREGVLRLDVDLPSDARVSIRSPRVLFDEVADRSSEPEAVRPPRRPDILMIVLDAARADRFGVYGDPRDVTPVLDALAAESLVFEDVLADCPYTLCSSPSFTAGLSFPQHGVVEKGHRLAPKVTTLAEVLQADGYHTVAYTANPNNAVATGAEQGFDEFYEVWLYRSGRMRTHPAPLSMAIAERIEDGFEDKPVFLLAHFVPPHEPYDPDPEHDLFGDPDYDGTIDGSVQQTRDVFFGRREVDEADVAELSALYDGNLRQADHWLTSIFDAQKATGRWDETIVVVTSDHGEAFGEHGAFGHNTTLYREMMHVPLIFRLPRTRTAPDADLASLASLSSVVPTVLDAIGLAPPAEITAPSLLAPRRPAVVVQRTSSPRAKVQGLATARFRVAIRNGQIAELFDRVADPYETENLAMDRPYLFAGLVARLERQLHLPSPFAAEKGELSAEDEEMLRSLGYL